MGPQENEEAEGVRVKAGTWKSPESSKPGSKYSITRLSGYGDSTR
jgi:hypothetical protein